MASEGIASAFDLSNADYASRLRLASDQSNCLQNHHGTRWFLNESEFRVRRNASDVFDTSTQCASAGKKTQRKHTKGPTLHKSGVWSSQLGDVSTKRQRHRACVWEGFSECGGNVVLGHTHFCTSHAGGGCGLRARRARCAHLPLTHTHMHIHTHTHNVLTQYSYHCYHSYPHHPTLHRIVHISTTS